MTAEEILNDIDPSEYCEGSIYGTFYYSKEDIIKAMVEFARYHTRKALEEAADNALIIGTKDGSRVLPPYLHYIDMYVYLDLGSIKNAYDLNQIT